MIPMRYLIVLLLLCPGALPAQEDSSTAAEWKKYCKTVKCEDGSYAAELLKSYAADSEASAKIKALEAEIARSKAISRALAVERRKSDSSTLVALYGPTVPVKNILVSGYDLLYIDNRSTSTPAEFNRDVEGAKTAAGASEHQAQIGAKTKALSNDRLILSKSIGRHMYRILIKTPAGVGDTPVNVDAECDVRLLKWGSGGWKAPVPRTIQATVLKALCP